MGHQPSLGAALGASPPKPLTPPTSWPSLELEVLDKMPVAIFSASRNPEDWSKGSLREVGCLENVQISYNVKCSPVMMFFKFKITVYIQALLLLFIGGGFYIA